MQSEEVLRSLAGLYDFQGGPTVAVEFEQGGLTLVFPNKDRYAMTPIEGAPLEFIHPANAVRATFKQSKDRTTISLYGDEGVRR